MTKEQIELKQLTDKITTIIPEICINENAQLIKFNHEVEYFKQYRPISLEDVLRAYSLQFKGLEIDYFSTNEFKVFLSRWQLGKPLHEQENETIKFLNSIIK